VCNIVIVSHKSLYKLCKCGTVIDSGNPSSKKSFTRAKRWWFDFYFNNDMKCHGQWIRLVCNVGVGDLPWVTASQQMFVNKIRLEQDPLAFLCLELWYRDRVQRRRHLANENNTFDVSVYASEPFVIDHVSIVTGQPTHSVGGRLVTVAGICRRLSSVGVCNTPRRACRRLHPRRPGDDVMPPAV